MKISRKKLIYALLLFLAIICFLFRASETAGYAFIGLDTWYQSMIKSLFPFMVLLNILIKADLTDYFIKPISFFLKPIFRISENAIFVIFFGFLCGFPLGAKCITDLYNKNKISFKCAEYLLCFTNNIGPAYFLGFVLQTIYVPENIWKSLFYMYGIPILYGVLLRYTIYRKDLNHEFKIYQHKKPELVAAEQAKISSRSTQKDISILSIIPQAIQDSLIQIAVLGGYMIIFNALRVIPATFLQQFPGMFLFSQSILEISGGLLCIKVSIHNHFLEVLFCHAALSFSGLCCYFQTLSLINATPLSGQKYMLHKIILCSITILSILLFH